MLGRHARGLRARRITFHLTRIAALLTAAFGGAAGARADASPAAALSLADARRVALERNWDLLAARSGVDAATAQRIVAREFPNPQISLTTSQVNVNGTGNATARGNAFWQRSYDTVVAVNQLLEIGGKRASRREAAAAGVAAAEARLHDARRVLENGVTQAYVAALLAGAKATIQRESAASLRREATIADKRFSSGDISRADRMQIEIASERLELEAASAENEAWNARVAVDVLLANPPAGNWAPADSLEQLAQSAAPLPPAAADGRPDLVAAQADLRKAEADLRLQRAQRVPDPSLVVQYEHQPPDLAESVGLGVSISLPLWNHNGGAIRAATVARDQARQQQRRLEAQIAAEIAIAQHAYVTAAEKLRRQREQIQPKSADVRRSVSLAYARGGASLLELLAAERSDNEARLATAQATADAVSALSAVQAALNISAAPAPSVR